MNVYDQSFKADPNVKLTKTYQLVEVKALDEGNGGFSAYVTTWGNVDRGGEKMMRGAVKESLESFSRDGWLAVGHNWVDMGVGFVKSLYEDDHGLYVEFEFHSDAEAQIVRKRVLERIAAGKSVSVSIGYYLVDWKVVDGILELHKINLMEVSIVNVPMNPLALATGAKSADAASFDGEAALVIEGLKHFTARVDDRILHRTDRKAGAELSSQNVATIDSVIAAIDALIEQKSKLQELADRNRKSAGAESTPAPEPSESEELKAFRAERDRARLLASIINAQG